MALRSVPGVQPRRAGEEPAESLPGAATAHRGARRGPPAPRAATIPRSPARAREVLDDVPTVSSDPSRPDVQARRAEVTRSRSGATSGSDSGSKRGLARAACSLLRITTDGRAVSPTRYARVSFYRGGARPLPSHPYR